MIAIIIVTLTALILSLIIVLVDKSNKVDEILKNLPGYNCGSCGEGSCEGLAYKILEDKRNYKKCRFYKEKD